MAEEPAEMPLIFEDDGKGKHQSVTASFNVGGMCGTGTYSIEVVGYGATREEARASAMEQMQRVRSWVELYKFRPRLVK